MPRPTKEEQTAIFLRNKKMFDMSKNYPINYLCIHFNLDKSVVSRILKRQRSEIKTGEPN